MLRLSNDCKCSELKVFPKNWNTTRAPMKKNWYIWYRFHDPLFKEKYPKGKLCVIKGMNEFKELELRQSATKALLDDELKDLQLLDYNPITGFRKEPIDDEVKDYEIDPDTGLCDALEQARILSDKAPLMKKDLKTVLKYFSVAAAQLRMDAKPVSEIRRRHIKMILEQCGKNKITWTANTFNFYRSHLSILFNELLEMEVVEFNPLHDIKRKKKVEASTRQLLTEAERKAINDNLRRVNYRFWRVMQLFFHSGSRTTEFMRLRKEDIDLNTQVGRYFVKKGREYRIMERPIKDCVVRLWHEVINEAKDGQYLFGDGLRPAGVPISPAQLTRRWKVWVKDKDWTIDGEKRKITADWYSLKHLNTTETVERVGTALAAKQNSHTEAVLKKHYDVNGKQRELEILKSVDNKFA